MSHTPPFFIQVDFVEGEDVGGKELVTIGRLIGKRRSRRFMKGVSTPV